MHPDRNVVTVNGDGGFLMNCQELETAVRLKTPIVNVIWENRQYGSIVWKQDKKFGTHFGTDFTNPDFVKLAEGFGMPAWRCESADEFGERLRHALGLDVPSLIVLPIDYSIDVAISEELGTEIVATCELWPRRPGGRLDMAIATQEQTVVDKVEKQLYIGGEWRDAAGGGTLEVIDPATEEALCEVADATPDDAMAALDAAVEAQRGVGGDGAQRPGRDPLEGLRAAERARRRARAPDDARDGQAGGRVEGGDRLRGGVLPLVLRRGAADRRQLQAGRQRPQPGARDEAAGRAVR